MKKYLVTFWVKRTLFSSTPSDHPDDCIVEISKDNPNAFDILCEVCKKLGNMKYNPMCLALINYWELD